MVNRNSLQPLRTMRDGEWVVAAKGTIIAVRTTVSSDTPVRMLSTPNDEPLDVIVRNAMNLDRERAHQVTGVIHLTTPTQGLLVEPVADMAMAQPDKLMHYMNALTQVTPNIWWLTPKGPMWWVPGDGMHVPPHWTWLNRIHPWAFLGPVPEVVQVAVEHACRNMPSTTLMEVLCGLDHWGLLSHNQAHFTQMGRYEELNDVHR